MNEICRETLERAYLLIDGEPVTEAERAQIQSHLEACEPCYQRYGIEAEVKRLIMRLRGCQPCPDGLRTKITTLLHDA